LEGLYETVVDEARMAGIIYQNVGTANVLMNYGRRVSMKIE
jgi:hypothetical protein